MAGLADLRLGTKPTCYESIFEFTCITKGILKDSMSYPRAQVPGGGLWVDTRAAMAHHMEYPRILSWSALCLKSLEKCRSIFDTRQWWSQADLRGDCTESEKLME